MSVEEYKLLMERSTMYLEEAREALDKGRYDISVFLAEQGLQLFLKAQLLRVLGDYRSPESGTLEWFRVPPSGSSRSPLGGLRRFARPRAARAY